MADNKTKRKGKMELAIKFQVLKSVSLYNEAEIKACDTDRTNTETIVCNSLDEFIKYQYPIGAVNSMGSITNLGCLPAVAFEYDSKMDYRTGDYEVSSMYISPFCDFPDGLTEMQTNGIMQWVQSWLDWLLRYEDWNIDINEDLNFVEASAPSETFKFNENQLELSL